MTATITRLIYESLIDAPLLVGNLPESQVFNRPGLRMPKAECALSFDQKLGHLYEDALGAIIEASPDLDCLASHLQVFDLSGITLGEMDFVVFDRAKKSYIHLELAVKFYLAVEIDGAWQFPGPDPRDNWQRKLERLCSHQLRLSGLDEAKVLLKERLGIQKMAVEHLIYGRVFYPVTSVERPAIEAMRLSAQTGRWLFVSQVNEYLNKIETVYLIEKPLWAVPLTSSLLSTLRVMPIDDLRSMAAERCVMFVPPASREPYFLVPDGWPDL